jgi:hypothetical protein
MPWKCEHGHVHGIDPDPCWTCQLEQSNRELNEANANLRLFLEESQKQTEEARNLVAEVLRDLPEAGKDNDDVFAVWNRLYRKSHWLHPPQNGREMAD